MNTICVEIPRNDFFTLYADGSLISKSSNEVYHELIFNKNNILILFYHFPEKKRKKSQHRRVYITCDPSQFENKNVYNLYGISKKRTVLFQLRGRSFDRFKNSLEYIKKQTNYECFKYPLEFWVKFCALNQEVPQINNETKRMRKTAKNSHHNIDELISIFKDLQ